LVLHTLLNQGSNLFLDIKLDKLRKEFSRKILEGRVFYLKSDWLSKRSWKFLVDEHFHLLE